MKKNIQMPEVRVINFRSNDVIATSGPILQVRYGGSNAQGGPTTAETGERSSIWD